MLKFFIFFLITNFTLFVFAEMDYISVPGADGQVLKFSRLIMGTDHLAQSNWAGENQPQPTEQMIFKVLDEAVRNGMNVIDTSPIYVGNIEFLVGKWLKSRKELIKNDDFYVNPNLNPDRKIYIISKGGFPFDLYYSKELTAGAHSEELKQALRDQGILSSSGNGNQSIKLEKVPPFTYASRLYGDVDQIEARLLEEIGHTMNNLGEAPTVWLMHRDDGDSVNGNKIVRNQTPVETIMKALSSDKLTEKYAVLGWSNWDDKRIRESLVLSHNNIKYKRPIFSSPYFSLFEEFKEQTIHSLGTEVEHADLVGHKHLRERSDYLNGIYLSPYSPLGGFSILDRPWEEAKADAKRKYENGDAYWKNVYHTIFTPENEMRYQRALDFTQKLNTDLKTKYTVDQVINAYALAHKRLDFLTVGPISLEQVQRTVMALSLAKKLTPDNLEYLYNVESSKGMSSRNYLMRQKCLSSYK